MANVITNYLSKQTGKKVTNTMLLNSIRTKASESYRADIPAIGDMKPINHANVPYANYEVHQNEFFNILINRIGATVVKALDFLNPLGVFKSELFEYGETLQELYVGLADKEDFDAKDNASPFKYADTDIRVFYHDLHDERKYRRTIDRAWTMKAFVSDVAFDEFIDKLFTSLLSADELDEFESVKALISKSLEPISVNVGGVATTIATKSTYFDITQDDYIVDFNKELIKRSNLFSVPSRTRFENGANVPSSTKVKDQYLLVDADFNSELDSLLANAFNMDKATVLANKIILDEFPVYTGELLNGEKGPVKPFACLISKKSLILKDKLLEMANIYNPNTLAYNYFLHHHQLVSYSLFENAHVYYTKVQA